MDHLVTVQEATALILETSISPEKNLESVSSIHSSGRVLFEPIFADRDFPPFDRATMDGIAIHFSALENGEKKFKIQGLAAAGDPQIILNNPLEAIEIMTGAILPLGADTIIRYEDILIEDGEAIILDVAIKKGQNVHKKGSDRKKGDILLEVGKQITPAEVAIFATVGKSEVQVNKLANIAIVATGDELVDIPISPLPHQIRMSNVYAIAAILKENAAQIKTFHLPDEEVFIHKTLEEILHNFEVVILSGGVSKGKKDYIPGALAKLGVEKIFHGVKQRPGKPFWFGKHPATQTPVFALPGNPVSSFMCTHRYIIPWLRKRYGKNPFTPAYAVLAEDFSFLPPLGYFLQVILKWGNDGVLWAFPFEGKGSGDLANVITADGFLELPESKNEFKKGESYPVILLR